MFWHSSDDRCVAPKLPQHFVEDHWGSYINLDQVNSRYGNCISLHDVLSAVELQPRIFWTHAHSSLGAFFEQDREVVKFVQRLLKKRRIVCVYRDGRDTLVSLYHYASSFNDRIAARSFSEFIHMSSDFDGRTCPKSMTRADYWAWYVDGWIDREEVYGVSFEQLTKRFVNTLTQVAHMLALGQPPSVISPLRTGRSTYWQWSYPYQLWKRMQGLLPIPSRYTAVEFRSGLSGGYRTMFSDDDLRLFNGHAADVTKALGYNISGYDENEG